MFQEQTASPQQTMRSRPRICHDPNDNIKLVFLKEYERYSLLAKSLPLRNYVQVFKRSSQRRRHTTMGTTNSVRSIQVPLGQIL